MRDSLCIAAPVGGVVVMSESVLEHVKEIDFEELKDGLAKGSLTLIDVRNPDELLTQGSIPGAINIPLPEVPDTFRNLTDDEFMSKYGFPKTTQLVFSCKSGRRAEAAIENLKSILSGVEENVRLYRGSFLDWVEKGGELMKSEGN